jgi:succinate-semialdehyde dehydrogenase/glutarate-semialdehyde dehydrogenase
MASAARDLPELALYIGGAWIGPGQGRDVGTVSSPATGEVLGKLPHAGPADLDDALGAAVEGFRRWRRMSAYDRALILRKAAGLVREREDRIATLLTLEEGKTLLEARLELRASADTIDWYADEGRRAYGRIVPPRLPGQFQMVVREPVGPVAAFAPWNFPALTPTRKMAASLAAGCSCIMKPSEETPYTCMELVRAFHDAGVPEGVINLVYGVPSRISEHLIGSDAIRKITFTGSTAVGKSLARLAADGVKRATLELGGHAPVVVFDDADIEAATTTLVAAKYRNAGQICIAPTRFYVQEQVFDAFVDRFVEKTMALNVGDGLSPESQMGPLANERRVDAVEELISDALDRGAKLRTGGQRIGNVGSFFQPTVLTDIDEQARAMNEEPFGPVALVNRFADFDDAVARANRLPFGLAAYAFTGSARTASAIGLAIEGGMVGINNVGISVPEAPFGGVKESGYGSESGMEGLDAFLSVKFISLT